MRTKILLLLFLIFGLALGAQTPWTADNLPMVHLQDARRYVCNPDGVLSGTAVARTDSILAALERKTGVQTVVVVVKRIEGGDPFTFSMALARKYGIGDKEKNSGLIIILSTEDREYGIFPGKGLEGTLPDARCFAIRTKYMGPALKEGKWDEAIVRGVEATAGVVLGDPEWTAATGGDADDGAELWMIIGTIAVILALAAMMTCAGRRRCPKCRKRTLQKVNTTHFRRGGKRYARTTWRCSRCGHTEITEHEDNDDGSGLMTAMAAGALLGGHRGGGGFSGGSFGGGSFGGGGSSGRF